MAGKAKFLFDMPFDGTKPKVEHAYKPKAPAPKITADELEAAKAQARAEGEAMGREAAYGQHQQAIEQALMAIEARLGQLAEARAQAEAQARAEAVSLAAAIARKLAAGLLAREPMREIEALVLRCLDDMRDEPRLVVRASEAVAQLLDQRVDQLVAQSGFGGKLMLVPDDTLPPGDCRIDWADGGAERNQAAIEKDVDLAVQRYLQGLRDEARATEGQ